MQSGRRKGGNRHRRMYELTGVPGWIRYGSSPGFAGGGRGLGPCAEYIQKTGQMDDFVQELSKNNPNFQKWQDFSDGFKPINPDNEKEMIAKRIRDLEEEIKELKRRQKNYR